MKKDMQKDIDEFGVWKLEDGELIPVPEIKSTKDYIHGIFGYALHHFIKDTHYKKNTQWYKDRGIKQFLILLRWNCHEHLESPIYGLSDSKFLELYGIEKNKLLFNKRKWIEREAV